MQNKKAKTKQNPTQLIEWDKIRTKKSKSTTKNEEVKTVMICWEAVNDLPEKEQEKEEKKPVKKMEKSKHEEEHVKSTLNTGNRLKI